MHHLPAADKQPGPPFQLLLLVGRLLPVPWARGVGPTGDMRALAAGAGPRLVSCCFEVTPTPAPCCPAAPAALVHTALSANVHCRAAAQGPSCAAAAASFPPATPRQSVPGPVSSSPTLHPSVLGVSAPAVPATAAAAAAAALPRLLHRLAHDARGRHTAGAALRRYACSCCRCCCCCWFACS
jgi:hypothetical protein